MLGVMELLARRSFLEDVPASVFIVANEDSAYFRISHGDLSKIGPDLLYHALAISWSRHRMRCSCSLRSVLCDNSDRVAHATAAGHVLRQESLR